MQVAGRLLLGCSSLLSGLLLLLLLEVGGPNPYERCKPNGRRCVACNQQKHFATAELIRS
jgi:hypothetical protein